MSEKKLKKYGKKEEICNKITISSYAFILFFGYTILVWLCEVVDLFAFVLNLPQTTLISRIFVLSIFILFILKNKNKFIVRKNNYSWIAIVGITIIFSLGIAKGIIPDGGFDTGNYHLIAQEAGFKNNFSANFGLGNFQVWGFRLADRLFYVARMFLGIRFGTQINTIVLIISYLQLSQILKYIRNRLNKSCIDLSEVYALIIILSNKNIMNLGSYYVDVIAFPVGLEILYLLLKARNEKVEKREIVYFALLNGFWFAFKLTNVVFIIPSIVLFICYVKKISIKTWILSGLGCLLPCLIYLVYNFICTGNPVFPYFNQIFRSPYFHLDNWKDYRWGPETLVEKIFWIFHAVFDPQNRQSEIPTQFTILFEVGIISAIVLVIIYIITRIRHIKNVDINIGIIIWFFISALLWGMTTGYERYFMFGTLVLAIIGYEGLLRLSGIKYLKIVIGVVVAVLIMNSSYEINEVIGGREWSYRNSKPLSETMKKNWSYVLCDQSFDGTFDVTKVKAFLVADPFSMGFAHWISPNTYVFNLSYLNIISNDVNEYYRNILNDYIIQGDIYDVQVTDSFDKTTYSQKILEYGLAIDSIEEENTNIGHCVFIRLKGINDK
ncbi:MAG: hypothetical protein PHR92_00765 [Lachnospiraceae bacterium]|nr:hypothetical protein [Lachnospiraceae bacterium]